MIRQGAPTGGRRRLTRWELEREAEQRERERNLAELMAELREARETEAEWYMWILNGRPVLTEAEYARVGRFGKGRRRSSGSTGERAGPELEAEGQPPQGVLM